MISNPLPLAELLETGVAIMVATRDAELRTHVTRGWGGYLDAGTGHGRNAQALAGFVAAAYARIQDLRY